MPPVRFGVIGLGDGGRCSLRSLQLLGAVPVALCDIDPAQCLEAMALIPKPQVVVYYDDYRELVQNPDIDLVIVATPDHLHFDPAWAAISAGKYVFVEKPLATTMDDVESFHVLARLYSGKLIFSEKWLFGYPMEALLAHWLEIDNHLAGHASFTQFQSELIMGDRKWRTEHAYNPCAGGGGHFATVLRLLCGPIVAVSARGHVYQYHGLEEFGGYDTMEGSFEFKYGRIMTWSVCIAIEGHNARLGHRSGHFSFQFKNGAFMYGAGDGQDRLLVNGRLVEFSPEPGQEGWDDYNIGVWYRRMHEDTLRAMRGELTLCTIRHGINAAAACALAFESAHGHGAWKRLPEWAMT